MSKSQSLETPIGPGGLHLGEQSLDIDLALPNIASAWQTSFMSVCSCDEVSETYVILQTIISAPNYLCNQVLRTKLPKSKTPRCLISIILLEFRKRVLLEALLHRTDDSHFVVIDVTGLQVR